MADLVKRVYQVFGPEPLLPEQKDLYVDLDEVRGNANLVNRLASRIRLSDEPTCQIVAGHPGSGKSTELRRLQQTLETGKHRAFVIFVQADQDIERNDVDFPEILVAVIRQTAKQLRDRVGVSLKPGSLGERLERLKDLLPSGIELEKLELSAAFLKCSVAMKTNPNARRKIRGLLDDDAGNWLYAANDLIGSAKQELKKKGYGDLVIVVDDLDKMVLRPLPEAGCSTGEYLFVHREAQLKGFECHVIYTMPIALAYSAQEKVIANLYGGEPPVVPMTKIACDDGSRFKLGFGKFEEIVRERLDSVAADRGKVFADETVLDRLIELSGGQPRELMTLIREAIVSDGLPITSAAVMRVEREAKRAYARVLRTEHWPVIEQIRRNPDFSRSRDTDSIFRDLLDSRAILQYVNDEEWYGVNPLVPDPPASLNNG